MESIYFKGDRPRSDIGSKESLENRLKLSKDENLDLLPPFLLRKYIAYARQYVKPKMSAEAASEIQV